MSGNNYKEELQHPKWQKRRLQIMSLYDFKCFHCGDDSETLHVHHLRYRNNYLGERLKPWEYEDNDLQCLCDTCHTLIHLNQKKICTYMMQNLNSTYKKTKDQYDKDMAQAKKSFHEWVLAKMQEIEAKKKANENQNH